LTAQGNCLGAEKWHISKNPDSDDYKIWGFGLALAGWQQTRGYLLLYDAGHQAYLANA
jgi:hypothetical protein